MNKYHSILSKILHRGKVQENRKGNIKYLLNQKLELKPMDLLELFEGHQMAKKKLKDELLLFMQGERLTERYREIGVSWWDYCGPILVNSYPTYFEQLPDLIKKINKEKRSSKNYVLFLGKNDTESNQQPCLSLIQFLISRQIDIPLKSITLFLGNVHIYENNIDGTEKLLDGKSVKFNLNVN